MVTGSLSVGIFINTIILSNNTSHQIFGRLQTDTLTAELWMMRLMKGKVEKEWTGLGHLADGSNRFLRVTFGQRRQVGWLLDDLIVSEERTTDVVVVTSTDARFLYVINTIIIDLIGLIT